VQYAFETGTRWVAFRWDEEGLGNYIGAMLSDWVVRMLTPVHR